MKAEKIKFTGVTGCKPRTVRLENGEITVVKKLFKLGCGYALYIPSEWLALLDEHGELEKTNYTFTFWYDRDKLIIEPLKSKVEGRIS